MRSGLVSAHGLKNEVYLCVAGSFWLTDYRTLATTGLWEQHCNTISTYLATKRIIISTTDDYGTVGLRPQHYNTTAALREQFFKLDILWAGYSAI